MNKDELKDRERKLKQRIMTLEWDSQHRQIHAGQSRKLEEYKKELADIRSQISE